MKADEKKELLRTLDSIRKLCAGNDDCFNCPLCVTRGCQLMIARPRDWQFANEAPKIWHAFYDKEASI